MGLLTHLLVCTIIVSALADEKRHPPHFAKYDYETKQNFELTRKSERIFVCKAHGIPEPKPVEWVQTESFAPNKAFIQKLRGNGNLQKDDFSANMAGVYQCQATNIYGVAVTNHIRLRLAYNAEFDKNAQPVLTTGTVGRPLQIPCRMTVKSLPDPVYTWSIYKDASVDGVIGGASQELQSNWRRSVGNNGTLFFAYLNKDDEKLIGGASWYYMCNTVNSVVGSLVWGSDTTIKVNDGPTNPIAPTLPTGLAAQNTVHVLEGEDLDLFCFFNGYPVINYLWTKTQMPSYLGLFDSTHILIRAAKDTGSYNGVYTCEGSLDPNPSNLPKASMAYTVIVDVLPHFETNALMVKNINATNGGDIEFECLAKGKPLPMIEWRINNVKVTNQNKNNRVTFSVNGNQGKFKMVNLQKGSATVKTDLCVISCFAYSSLGERYGSGYLNVFTPLAIAIPPADVTVMDSKQVLLLNCSVTSDPSKEFTVDWFRDDLKLIFSKRKLEKLANNSLVIYAKKFESVGDITGTYTCQAATSLPNQLLTASAKVTVDAGGGAGGVTTAGGTNLWWIAIIVAIILIIIILLLIFCCIKRNKGESYPVDENERKTGNNPEMDLSKPEHGGFTDYQRNEKDPIGGSRASLDGSIKPLDSDDDDDSMAEYGDLDTGKFNEDGSFIGQYIPPDKNRNTHRDNAPPPYTRGSDSMV